MIRLRDILEGVFDKDLVTKKTLLEIKHERIDDLKRLLNKYGVPFEYDKTKNPWNGEESGTEYFKINLEKIYKDALTLGKKPKTYNIRFYVYPTISFPLDKLIFDKPTWTSWPPQLWVCIEEDNDKLPPTKYQLNFNKYHPIFLLDFKDKRIDDDKSWNDYLGELERVIKWFQSDSFNNRTDLLVDVYIKRGKPIPLQDIKRLVEKL